MNDFTPHPLLPPSTLHGRTLIVTLAIMAFLSMLSIAAVDMIAQNALRWRGDIAREMTVQVKPVEGRLIEQDLVKVRDILRATKGVSSISVYSKEESSRLLEPFLGAGALLSELPIPRLIAITLDEKTPLNSIALKEALKIIPNASFDDHQPARTHLATMAMTLVFLGIVVVFMMLLTSALTVIFATRAAVATNKAVVEVLHFVGAQDAYIAKQFERYFLIIGIKGAVIGVLVAAVLVLSLAGLFGFTRVTAVGDQLEALFGRFSLSFYSVFAGIALAVSLSLLTAVTSHKTVMSALRSIE